MNPDKSKTQLRSVAMRVHNMHVMLAFYSEAFGIQFEEVMTGPFKSQFGRLSLIHI